MKKKTLKEFGVSGIRVELPLCDVIAIQNMSSRVGTILGDFESRIADNMGIDAELYDVMRSVHNLLNRLNVDEPISKSTIFDDFESVDTKPNEDED